MSNSGLENHTGRTFSFYPPILHVEHNEWSYEEATWSEIRVHNPKSGLDLWIPRRFVGEVSQIDEPVMIVGLTTELEYTGGMVTPHRRRMFEMSGASPSGPPSAQREPAPPPPPPSRKESGPEQKIGRFIIGSLLVAIVGTFLVVMVTRDRQSGGRISYQTVLQADLGLTAQDDYYSVVRKLGEPQGDRWKAEAGERQYRALDYPERGITVILMGADRDHALYIGAKDANWKNVHTVELPGGANSDSILRSIQPF